MMKDLFTFRVVVTVLLGAAYIGGMAWAMLQGKLDAQSYISGIGPAFGLAMGYWFREHREP